MAEVRTTANESSGLSPRSFLKGRRPEQFSDSVVEENFSLDRSLLEFHLDTLTSRSQELLFENFVRKLAQKTLCPNLMPHTGPTGGGDSKVDSETFSVAEALANTWYVGAGSEAATERWAFAFSAKKVWKPKLESDVEKIVATGRGYRKAYFISNQSISDRARSSVEDALTKRFGLDVRVLDRTWILDRVFDGGHEELAITELGMAVSARKVMRVGPLDSERRMELDELELRITSAAERKQFDSVYVADCLDAAINARELELPQLDVEGRFLRADKAAKKWGSRQQKLQANYQFARTMYFWFEEFDEIPRLYLECEALVIGTNSAYDLELLANTWYYLLTLNRHGNSEVTDAWLAERTQVLLAEANRLAAELDRPSNAHQARATGLLVQLAQAQSNFDPILRELRVVVDSSEGLVGFPARQLFDLVVELGSRFGTSAEYDRLFESTVKLTTAREGELTTASMLLRRGSQFLNDGRPADVIRVVGRTLRLVYKHESRSQLISALQMIGVAYQQIGLLWAARGSILTAASIISSDFHTYGNISVRLADCAQRLKWIELELGRLAQSWDWHQLEAVVRDVVARQSNELPNLFDMDYNAVLGIMLLRLDMTDLKHMTKIVDVLEDLGLPVAAVALKYVLGHEDELPLEELGFADDPVDGFRSWRDQPAGKQLNNLPDVGESEKCKLVATIIGCRIEASVTNEPSCIALAETLLAALESFLSTSMAAAVAPLGSKLSLNVVSEETAQPGFDYERVDDDGLPAYLIKCSKFNPYKLKQSEASDILDGLHKLIVDLVAHGFLIRDVEEHITKLFRDELALERSLNFTQSFIHVGNVLGHSAKLRVSDWSQNGANEFEIRRTEPWDARVPQVEARGVSRAPLRPGTGPVPEELVDEANMRHTDFMATSVIRLPLWDEAKWFAAGFMMTPGVPYPPRLALIFRNREAGIRIFEVWKKEYGERIADTIRVAIIRGIDKTHPDYYRISIGANLDDAIHDSRYFMLFSRMCEMAPLTSRNLEQFLVAYSQFNCFYLLPGYATEGSPIPEFFEDHEIHLTKLVVRQAWEIGPHDFDLPALSDNDDPIVPPEVAAPPYLDALKMRRERRQS